MLKELIEEQKKQYDVVVAIGPMVMMKFVCLAAKGVRHTYHRIHEPHHGGRHRHVRSLQASGGRQRRSLPVLTDPEFDGHLIDWSLAMKRMNTYKTEEGRAMLEAQEGETHHGGCGNCGGDR